MLRSPVRQPERARWKLAQAIRTGQPSRDRGAARPRLAAALATAIRSGTPGSASLLTAWARVLALLQRGAHRRRVDRIRAARGGSSRCPPTASTAWCAGSSAGASPRGATTPGGPDRPREDPRHLHRARRPALVRLALLGMPFWNALYVASQVIVLPLTLFLVYRYRRPAYAFVRNMASSPGRRARRVRAAAGRAAAAARVRVHRHGQQPDLLQPRLRVRPRLLQPGRGHAEPARRHGAGRRVGAHQAHARGSGRRASAGPTRCWCRSRSSSRATTTCSTSSGGLAWCCRPRRSPPGSCAPPNRTDGGPRRRPIPPGPSRGPDIRPVDRGSAPGHHRVRDRRRPTPGSPR